MKKKIHPLESKPSLNERKLPSGPFTQLVWGSTQKFGCGKARNSNGKARKAASIFFFFINFNQVVVVAYYWPRGNRPDQVIFRANEMIFTFFFIPVSQ